MGNARHLAVVLGTFALAGVGLAMGIGLSSSPPATGETAEGVQRIDRVGARPAPGGLHAPRADSPDLARPAAGPDDGAFHAPYRYSPSPPGPVLARPAPAHAQQALPDPPDAAEKAGPPLDMPAPPAPPRLPAPPTLPPMPVAKPAARPSGPAVQGEGDGRLVINIRDEDLRRVLEMLSEQGGLNILASSSVQGKVSATLSGVDLESALRAILRSTGYVSRRDGQFIYVGTPQDFEQMEHAADQIGTRVYRPNYVKASDLKDLIQPLLSEKLGVVSVTAPAEIGIGADDDKVGGNNFAGGEAVLVRDYEAVLTQIDQVVAEIDVRPMQVHIEAMILSVRLNDSDKFGVDFKKLINGGNFVAGWGTPVDNLAQVTFTQGGLKLGFLDGDIGVFLQALEHVGDTNVIATPRLMVLNRQRADILIGRQEGYVSTTAQTETATTQSVQFLDLGTQLRLRPFISPDGLVRMEIHPELSDGSVEVKGSFTLPKKDVTKVTTNIMVRDGCTVVIGGLMQEQLATTVDQVPYFGNLPLVGVLFRTKEEKTKRVEIIVLVTPHIVYEPETCREGELGASEFHRRQEVYREKMSPLGKRSVGRRYYRMAQQAWAEGDRRRALRFAEMAVHFDPLNRAAIDLRSDIWQGNPAGAHTLPPAGESVPPGPLDGRAIAPWVLEDLETPAGNAWAPLLHPLDPGQPGRHKDIDLPRVLR